MLYNAYARNGVVYSLIGFALYETSSLMNKNAEDTALDDLTYSQAYGGGGLSVSW